MCSFDVWGILSAVFSVDSFRLHMPATKVTAALGASVKERPSQRQTSEKNSSNLIRQAEVLKKRFLTTVIF